MRLNSRRLMPFKLIPGIVAAVQLRLALTACFTSKPGNTSPLRDPDSKQNLKKGFLVLDISGTLLARAKPPAFALLSV